MAEGRRGGEDLPRPAMREELRQASAEERICGGQREEVELLAAGAEGRNRSGRARPQWI